MVALSELLGGDIAVVVLVAVVEGSLESVPDCFWATFDAMFLGDFSANPNGIIEVDLAMILNVLVDELTDFIHCFSNVDFQYSGSGGLFKGRGREGEGSEGEELHSCESLCFVY